MNVTFDKPEPVFVVAVIGDSIYDTLDQKISAFYAAAGVEAADIKYLPHAGFLNDRFPHFDVELNTNIDSLQEILHWCESNFENNWLWSFGRFYFIRPEDATMFALRWQCQ